MQSDPLYSPCNPVGVQLAHVARTPWLDPCVAGGILALKALSEGDWRLGKGALADWADHSLRAASDVGARVFGLASGDVVSPVSDGRFGDASELLRRIGITPLCLKAKAIQHRLWRGVFQVSHFRVELGGRCFC